LGDAVHVHEAPAVLLLPCTYLGGASQRPTPPVLTSAVLIGAGQLPRPRAGGGLPVLSGVWDGCCSSHRVAPCASQHPQGLPWHTLSCAQQYGRVSWQLHTRTTRTCCPPGLLTPAGRVPAHEVGRELQSPAGAPLVISSGFLLPPAHTQAALSLKCACQTHLAVTAAEY
jgi:hypothetical protein